MLNNFLISAYFFMEATMYYCCGKTDIGNTRSNNEDSFLINKIVMTQAQIESNIRSPFIVAVADGVAGEASGEIASRLALELLSNIKYSKKTDLNRKIINIHNFLRRYGITHNKSINMQTTLCALAVDEFDNATLINIGDSRMYRFRGGSIEQLSTDQSLVQLLYDQGHITKEEQSSHAHRNIIFPVLGHLTADPTIEISEIEGGICYGDLIIICTDGLSDYISKVDFEEILALPLGMPKRLSMLIDKALANGSPDNLTVMGISAFEE